MCIYCDVFEQHAGTYNMKLLKHKPGVYHTKLTQT